MNLQLDFNQIRNNWHSKKCYNLNFIQKAFHLIIFKELEDP